MELAAVPTQPSSIWTALGGSANESTPSARSCVKNGKFGSDYSGFASDTFAFAEQPVQPIGTQFRSVACKILGQNRQHMMVPDRSQFRLVESG